MTGGSVPNVEEPGGMRTGMKIGQTMGLANGMGKQ